MKKIFLAFMLIYLLIPIKIVCAQVYTYTDDYAKVEFKVDESIWIEAELSEEREYISNKWTKDCGMILYGSNDAYSSLSAAEKNGLTRKDFNHTLIDQSFAVDYTQGFETNHNIEDYLIQEYNLKFLDFYGNVNLSGISTGFDYLTTINNGYLITFQYYGDGCSDCITEVENIAKSVKSTLPINTSSNLNAINNATYENDSNKESNNWLLQLVFSICFTIICYLTFPIIRLIMHKEKFDKNSAKKIALWNSIIVGGIFAILTIESGAQWSAVPAFLYYYINKAILTKKNDFTVNFERDKNSFNNDSVKEQKNSYPHYVLSDPNERVVKQRGLTYGDDVRIQEEKTLADECDELKKRLDELEKRFQSNNIPKE